MDKRPADKPNRDTKLTPMEEYGSLRSSLMLERASFESHWRDLSDYIMPRRLRFQVTDRNKGERRNQKIIDSTATFAARTLRSGMHAGITSPARPWMKLTTPDPELAEFGSVKEWLHIVTQRMLTVFLRSNLYNVLPLMYGDMGVFGTAAIGCLEDDRDLVRFYSYPIGSYALGVSARQQADTFIRDYPMTVRQIVYEFGLDDRTNEIDWTNISKSVKDQWNSAQFDKVVDVCWVITPNRGRDRGSYLAKHKPWASCYYELGSNEGKFLRESGFDEFPIIAPRWDVTGEDIYGTDCPGMTVLGDVKALQTMQKRKAQAVEKMINPPLQAPTSVRNQKPSVFPGDVTYHDAREGQKGITPIHEVNMRIEAITADIQDTRGMIRRGCYEDLFLMLAQSDRREITASEIDERHEEKLLALGPVLERTNDEALDPLVDRVYSIMERAGLIPEPPPELEAVDLKVEYISLMAQAQKLVGIVGNERFMSSVAQILPLFPSARHKISVNDWIDAQGEMLGINPKIIIPDEAAQAAADAEQKAMAAQQQSEVMANTAGAAKDLSQTDLESDNAMSRLLGVAA